MSDDTPDERGAWATEFCFSLYTESRFLMKDICMSELERYYDSLSSWSYYAFSTRGSIAWGIGGVISFRRFYFKTNFENEEFSLSVTLRLFRAMTELYSWSDSALSTSLFSLVFIPKESFDAISFYITSSGKTSICKTLVSKSSRSYGQWSIDLYLTSMILGSWEIWILTSAYLSKAILMVSRIKVSD